MDVGQLDEALRLHQAGRLEEAEQICRGVLVRDPTHPEANYLLGLVLQTRGQLAEAAECYRAALAHKPELTQALCNLGVVLRAQGRLVEALQCLEQAASLSPESAEILNNLGLLLNESGRPQEAIPQFRRAIAMRPEMIEAHNNLGTALQRIGQAVESIEAFRTAARIDPDRADTFNNLANVLTKIGRLNEALACYDRAITLEPENAEAHRNLGIAFKEAGHLGAALAQFDRALALKPDYAVAHSDRLYTIHFHPDYDAAAIFEAHRVWNERHAKPLAAAIRPHGNDRATERTSTGSVAPRLRIGYVSPDFRDHAIGRFMLPLLANHDRAGFEIFCYSDLVNPDAMTERIRRHIYCWRSTAGLSDAAVAELVREDRIDILVDLAMHMGGSRILVFARKPAPVQVTYLAYCSTTGLETMDYRLTDPYLDPIDAVDAHCYSERSIQLPRSYWCYDAPDAAPAEVSPLPALSAGHITFGCLNTFCKITPPTVQTWCKILHAVPGSRLLIHAGEGTHRRLLTERIAALGIDPARIAFAGYLPFGEYFEQYHYIDIALDPFPYAGGTTTCDALWMGVPVVTVAGRTAVGRSGVSILSNVGLPDLIAWSEEEYVRRAVNLAADFASLVQLRAGLRERMQRSPLMDASRFARDVEAMFGEMWKRWAMIKA